MNDLTDKYRPTAFEAVLGQDNVVASLKEIIEKDNKLPSTILFHGPSGVGKTTLARICAKAIGCLDSNIIEINAAKFTGVEDMREATELSGFMSLGSSRVFILDEAQRLSKQAFDSLLKFLEEPIKGTSWIFCSTEPTKIPKNIKTRCHIYELKKVEASKIRDLLSRISDTEKFNVDKQILTYIAMKAEGSPRQAIKFLDMSRGLPLDKVRELIKAKGPEEGSPEIVKLCQIIVSRRPFLEALEALKAIEGFTNESIRITVLAYLTKCVYGSKSVDNTKYLLQAISAFSSPYIEYEKNAPILISLAIILID